MKSGYIYSVSDKALFDAINNSKVSNKEIQDIFFARGILISKDTPKNELAFYYSVLPSSFREFERLTGTLGTKIRKERSSSCLISKNVKKDDLIQAAQDLCKSIQDNHDGHADCNILPSGEIEIKINYEELKLDRSELRQTVKKEAVIVFEKNKDGYTLRVPANPDCEKWKEDLIQKIQKGSVEEIKFNDISLEHILEPALRTQFFTELIGEIGELELLDVTDAYVFHPKKKIDSDADDLDAEIDLGVHISKASLKGEGVLQSEEIRGLYEKGFYIWKIVWRCKERLQGSDQIEIEAQFSEAESFTGFSYIVKGQYRYKSLNEYSRTRTPLSYILEKNILQKLEKKAHETIQLISDQATGEKDDENKIP